jgi:hypothetical protein
LLDETGEFLCFQCHAGYGEANREELKHQLRVLSSRSRLTVLLVPIGRIYPFEDDVFLESLSAELGVGVRLLPACATIYDIGYTLASARLFCGTSLHGVVTALAYGAPIVAVQTSDPKLRYNVESWGLEGMFPMVTAAGIAERCMHCLALERRAIQTEAARLTAAASANMRELADRILTDNPG